MKTRTLIGILGIFLLLNTISLHGQEIGIRYGKAINGNLAVDGVFAFKQSRIHADVSFSNSFFSNGVGAAVLYDFTFRPTKNDGWTFYMGAGPVANFQGSNELFGTSLDLGGAFEIGTEYKFANAPIVVGIDWRPTLMMLGNSNLSIDLFGINARYVF